MALDTAIASIRNNNKKARYDSYTRIHWFIESTAQVVRISSKSNSTICTMNFVCKTFKLSDDKIAIHTRNWANIFENGNPLCKNDDSAPYLEHIVNHYHDLWSTKIPLCIFLLWRNLGSSKTFISHTIWKQFICRSIQLQPNETTTK